MKINILCILTGIFLVGCSQYIYSQKTVNKSEKKRPDWLASKLPQSSNNTFYYQVTETNSKDINEAREASILTLATYIKNNLRVRWQGEGNLELSNTNIGTEEKEQYNFKYIIEGKSIDIISRKIDEYWEYISYPNGKNEYRFFTLYAVSSGGDQVQFDQVSFTYKYGTSALVKSLIPGMGQIHKGSHTKGYMMLGGEIALLGGVAFCESQRSSYRKKINQTQNVDHIRSYDNKADNYQTARDLCIGGAVALYIYNLIDAVACDGRKRTITKKSRNNLVLAPAFSPEYNGISLSLNF